jgi:hypothetical protein
MHLRLQIVVCALAFMGLTSGGFAQDEKGDLPSGASRETLRPGLTGKERLGEKWTDEQRIDNCRVPIDKRGTKPRPSACASDPSS